MNFCKSRYRAAYAAGTYFAIEISIAIVLTVFSLAFLNTETANGEVSRGLGNTRQPKQANVLKKGGRAADQAEYKKISTGKSDDRHVRVGLYENKPKIFTDETGSPSGIFVDILNEIAKKEKWQLIYVPCKWQGCLEALEQGRLDLMPDVAFSTKRAKKFAFHEEAVVSSWSVVYTGNRKRVDNITDLEACGSPYSRDRFRKRF